MRARARTEVLFSLEEEICSRYMGQAGAKSEAGPTECDRTPGRQQLLVGFLPTSLLRTPLHSQPALQGQRKPVAAGASSSTRAAARPQDISSQSLWRCSTFFLCPG